MEMKLLASLLVIILICNDHVSDAAVTLYQGDEGELITKLWYIDVAWSKNVRAISPESLGNFIPTCYKIVIALRMIEKQDMNNFEPECRRNYYDARIKVYNEEGNSNDIMMLDANICICKAPGYFKEFVLRRRRNASHQYFVITLQNSGRQVRGIFDLNTEVFSAPKLQDPENKKNNTFKGTRSSFEGGSSSKIK